MTSEIWRAVKVGCPTGLTMFATSSNIEPVLNLEKGQISVAVAVTCTVFICGLVWYLASRFQALADGQADVSRRLSRIENDLNDLPCGRNGCLPKED
jgi:hypothetical protein